MIKRSIVNRTFVLDFCFAQLSVFLSVTFITFVSADHVVTRHWQFIGYCKAVHWMLSKMQGKLAI